ncbi:hypothetical protein [Paenibacillus glucanolyticus]|uniref:hypothetical protein n=1 Tax=Paenibacillus glucanolyticus TaxID=59843 RepID=UPI00096CBC56|nr:hypothetical protein [Paenibacillus glucanolyticus]MCA4751095.1 hypothetical protein [Mycolicibacterium fortuitum]MPY17511.1 hypothetical protein [Paenibacillus glucanolyticus]OMF76294.1 hypothetical protein BK142_15000 [Paenibacillus glucanolyticus]
MARFGETILLDLNKPNIVVSAAEDGPFGNDHSGFSRYLTDPGWIIIDYRAKPILDRGKTKIQENFYPSRNNDVIHFEEIDDKLDILLGNLKDKFFEDNPSLKATYDILKHANELGWNSEFTVYATATYRTTSHGAQTAAIKKGYAFSRIYVGSHEEFENRIKEWLAGVEVTKEYIFNDYKEQLLYRARFHLITEFDHGNVLWLHEPPGGDPENLERDSDTTINSPSVALDIPDIIPLNAKIIFKAYVSTEGAPERTVKLVLWDMSGPRTLFVSDKVTLTNLYNELTCSYTPDPKDLGIAVPIRAEIYWYDNNIENLIVGLEKTSVLVRKSF